jgi:hypothetical protein
LDNVLQSVENGEIIEDYPKSRISPSCLISGMDYESNPVYSVWGYFKEKLFSVLITVYKPNQTEWMDEKETIKMYSLWNWKNKCEIGRKDFIV